MCVGTLPSLTETGHTGRLGTRRPHRRPMALEILCPNCDTDDHLTGDRRDDVIVVTCGACGLSWERPVRPHCYRCGSTDVVAQPVPLLERSRGTQLSVTAMHIETLCRVCDADKLGAPGDGHMPPGLGQPR